MRLAPEEDRKHQRRAAGRHTAAVVGWEEHRSHRVPGRSHRVQARDSACRSHRRVAAHRDQRPAGHLAAAHTDSAERTD